MEVKMLDKAHSVNPETGFTCRYIRSDTEHFRPHRHNYYEIFLIIKNKAWHMINGRKHLLSEGNRLFIRDFDVHDYMPAGL